MKAKFAALLIVATLFSVDYCMAKRSIAEKGTVSESPDANRSMQGPLLLTTLVLFLGLGVQTVFGQKEEVSVGVGLWLEQLRDLQKDIQRGATFSQSAIEMHWINRATKPEERNQFYEKMEPNKTERKKMDEAFNAIAKSLNKQDNGVSASVSGISDLKHHVRKFYLAFAKLKA